MFVTTRYLTGGEVSTARTQSPTAPQSSPQISHGWNYLMFPCNQNNTRGMFTDTMRLPQKNTLPLYVTVYYDLHAQQRICYMTGCWVPLPNNAAYASSNYGHFWQLCWGFFPFDFAFLLLRVCIKNLILSFKSRGFADCAGSLITARKV